MKTWLRQIVPTFIIEKSRQFRRYLNQKNNSNRSIEQVFTDIYTQNKWGGDRGTFCSGSGTKDDRIVECYVAKVTELANSEGFKGLNFVDLGCGDFQVGKQLVALADRYVGVDIVLPLIERNRQEFGTDRIGFEQLNLVDDDLPPGDVCFIRQVFQHLSNQQIATILPKLGIYRWVFITEHYPTDNNQIAVNLDKVHGGDIRLFKNSGVYLTEPPFSLPIERVAKILEVLGHDHQAGEDRGVIRTFLYQPQPK